MPADMTTMLIHKFAILWKLSTHTPEATWTGKSVAALGSAI